MNQANTVNNRKRDALMAKSLITAKEARLAVVPNSLLDYYCKTGSLAKVGRGIYINTKHAPKIDFEWEDLVYTTLSISNGVITGISALAIYGLTEEVARFHWIAVPNATSKGDRPNLKLVRVRNIELGRTTIKMGDVDVPIFDVERTLVEAFRLTSVETAIKALKAAFAPGSKHKPDAKKMLDYARKLHVKIDSYLMMVTT
jgi:predicted transcriptional regulator of viral defense system